MDPLRSQKTDLAWAGVYLSLVCATGLALLLGFARGSPIERIAAVDLVLGWIGSVTAVVVLLAFPTTKPLVVVGRVLVVLVYFALVVAAVLGSVSIAQG